MHQNCVREQRDDSLHNGEATQKTGSKACMDALLGKGGKVETVREVLTKHNAFAIKRCKMSEKTKDRLNSSVSSNSTAGDPDLLFWEPTGSNL